jgi:hypothetical protein
MTDQQEAALIAFADQIVGFGAAQNPPLPPAQAGALLGAGGASAVAWNIANIRLRKAIADAQTRQTQAADEIQSLQSQLRAIEAAQNSAFGVE